MMKLFFWRKGKKPSLPLVTVITATYNAAETIERTIESVVQQIYKNIEFIFVDGLSQDGTTEIIQAAARKDKRIKYISEKDQGPYDAMNKGISMSSGDWIYFLGADDMLIQENTLQELFEAGYFSQEKVFYGNVIIEGDTSWAKDKQVYAGEFNLPELLKRNICHQAIFYPRKIVERAGFFNNNYIICADWDYNMRCFAFEPFFYVDKVIARFQAGGVSSSGKDPAFSKEFPGNIIRYFNLYPDDLKLIESDSPFRSVILSYRKLQKEGQ